jgi:hypothetical protein
VLANVTCFPVAGKMKGPVSAMTIRIAGYPIAFFLGSQVRSGRDRRGAGYC